MTNRKVRVNSKYKFVPVGMDIFSPCCAIPSGTIVRVVNKHGCPPANTQGHCYMETLDGAIFGLVLTNSLQPIQT